MILMDTHIFLWFHQGHESLKPKEVELLIQAHKQERLCLSAISIWEIAMLEKLNRIAFQHPLELWLTEATKNITILPIDTAISLESVRLPSCEHKDPADRFIMATARIMNCELATHDIKIMAYAKAGHVKLW